MISLILLLVFAGLVVFTATYFNRRGKDEQNDIVINENSECCGAHEVCERDNLQIIDTKIEYFDDEELDTLAELAWQQDGVIGSRMTGAGFGGCTVSLVRDEALPAFLRNIASAYAKKIGYAPDFYIASIAGGAGKI